MKSNRVNMVPGMIRTKQINATISKICIDSFWKSVMM